MTSKNPNSFLYAPLENDPGPSNGEGSSNGLVTSKGSSSVLAMDRVPSVCLSWHNINVIKKSSRYSPCKKPDKIILQNVSGHVQSGQLLAIMGSSGSGKTTLNNVLTQRNLSSFTVEKLVKLNGNEMNTNSIKMHTSYVQQKDIFIGNLTVREHMRFQFRVRIDQSMTKEDRERRVNEELQKVMFGLTTCADTKIGKPNDEKGISGGEKKRLAVASELLTDPLILFCDEPTSGLDSYLALNIIQVLKQMADTDRTIVCTIHQPSPEVFALFTHLLLMADGRVAYLGPTDKAVEYFTNIGYPCPGNPSDFLIKTLAVKPNTDVNPNNENVSRDQINLICNKYEQRTLTQPVIYVYHAGGLWVNAHQDKMIYKTNWFTQFRTLLWRSWMSTIREPMITYYRLIPTIFTAVFFGLIYWQLDNNQAGIMSVNGALFLLLSSITFQNIFGVVTTFCIEMPVFLREHNNGMYRVSAYFLSKILAELPLFLFHTFVYILIFYWMVGLTGWLVSIIFWKCVLISLLVADTACSFGYLVSCFSNGIIMALTIAPTVLMPMMIFGGFFLNIESIPVWLSWIKYLSWFYYGNEALSINQWQNVYHIDCEYKQVPCITNGTGVIKSLHFNEDHFYQNMGLLFALSMVVRLLAFISLWVRSSLNR